MIIYAAIAIMFLILYLAFRDSPEECFKRLSHDDIVYNLSLDPDWTFKNDADYTTYTKGNMKILVPKNPNMHITATTLSGGVLSYRNPEELLTL